MPLKNILLAEDNMVNQLVASRQIEMLGYECDVVANGQEALDALNKKTYDLILMDCEMPVLDGYQATTAIRNGNNQKDIPIVALTATASDEARAKCKACGMNEFLTKPIDIKRLTEVLSSL